MSSEPTDNHSHKYIKISNEFILQIGSKISVTIGIRTYVGEIVDINEYNQIVARDVYGHTFMFKPFQKSVQVITILSDEDYEKLRERYQVK